MLSKVAQASGIKLIEKRGIYKAPGMLRAEGLGFKALALSPWINMSILPIEEHPSHGIHPTCLL